MTPRLHAPELERAIRKRLSVPTTLICKGDSEWLSNLRESLVNGLLAPVVPALILLFAKMSDTSSDSLRSMVLIFAAVWMMATATYLAYRIREKQRTSKVARFLRNLPTSPEVITGWAWRSMRWDGVSLIVQTVLWISLVALTYQQALPLAACLLALAGTVIMVATLALIWARWVPPYITLLYPLNLGGAAIALLGFASTLIAEETRFENLYTPAFEASAAFLSPLAHWLPTGWQFTHLSSHDSPHWSHSIVATLLGIAAISAIRPLHRALVAEADEPLEIGDEDELTDEDLEILSAMELGLPVDDADESALPSGAFLEIPDAESRFAHPQSRIAQRLDRWTSDGEKMVLQLFQAEPLWARNRTAQAVGWLLLLAYALHPLYPQLPIFQNWALGVIGVFCGIDLNKPLPGLPIVVDQGGGQSRYFTRIPIALADLIRLRLKVASLELVHFVPLPLAVFAIVLNYHYSSGDSLVSIAAGSIQLYFFVTFAWLSFQPAIAVTDIQSLSKTAFSASTFLVILMIVTGLGMLLTFFSALSSPHPIQHFWVGFGLIVLNFFLGALALFLAIRRHNLTRVDLCGLHKSRE